MNTIPLGQMSTNEKKYIYDTIKNTNSKQAIESGTWYGGGSTLSLVKGLYETEGVLYTFEENYSFYEVAKRFYDNSIYVNNIKLYNTSFINGLKNLSYEFLNSVDLILLDGGDELPNGLHKLDISAYIQNYNVSENVQSFKFLEDKIRIGCNLLLHDWSVPEGRGNFIQRYLQDTNNTNFKLIRVIPGSTGLAHIQKIK
jgi:hypothetical protein